MYRRGSEIMAHNQFNFVLNHGAIGDVISSLPAIIHARRTHHKDMTLRVWCGSWLRELIETLLEPYGHFEFENFEDLPPMKVRKDWDRGPLSMNGTYGNIYTRCRVDMVDFAFNTLLDGRVESPEWRDYPNLAPLGSRPDIKGPYIVFAAGATSENKTFHNTVMEPIIEWASHAGYTPVIVGSDKSHVKVFGEDKNLEALDTFSFFDKISEHTKGVCLDLRNKTTLIELRNILGYAAAVLGVDGGTLHLAGTTDTPIVYGLTTVMPAHRHISRNGEQDWRMRQVTPRKLECAGCQSNWTLLVGFDYRTCAYQDYACVEKLDPNDFITALKSLGVH